MDTFRPDVSTYPLATRTLRRLAATAAGTGGLIALAAAAYATLHPTAAVAQLTPTVAAVVAPAAPATHPEARILGSVSDDTVATLNRTFSAPASTQPATDDWMALFHQTKATDAPLATNTTATAVTPAVDGAARPASLTEIVDEDNDATFDEKAPGDVVWTPTTAPSTDTSASATAPNTAPAAPKAPANALVSNGVGSDGKIAIAVNRTAEIRTNVPVKRVSIGQPDIADVQPFSSNLILVTAKKPGSTQVIIWDDQDRSQSIDVNVEIPLEQLRDMVRQIAPGANIEVGVANDTIVLRGHAPNLTIAKQIGDIAGAYGKVQNFIEVAGTQTVAVQVQFAEVSRSVTNSLGVDWGFSDGTSVFGSQPGSTGGPFGLAGASGSVNGSLSVPGDPLPYDIFYRGVAGHTPFDIFIKALRENSMLRVLQEPTLTATSGEPATFLAGGQVAVPVPADNGTVGIEYKEFGVRLKLTPVVLGNGKVRLIMEAESSELDYANGTKIQAATVPGLRTRRVTNTVELGEGQTMSVAGLLDDSVVATKQSIPGLGDLPVLGSLFRSTRYQRKETELVILITPRLSGAMNPDQVPPLPGANWRHPSELEQFALGDMGGNAEADAVRDWNRPVSERGLRGSETQRAHPSNEPAARTDASQLRNAPPPRFFGEHGFTRAPEEETATTSARD